MGDTLKQSIEGLEFRGMIKGIILGCILLLIVLVVAANAIPPPAPPPVPKAAPAAPAPKAAAPPPPPPPPAPMSSGGPTTASISAAAPPPVAPPPSINAPPPTPMDSGSSAAPVSAAAPPPVSLPTTTSVVQPTAAAPSSSAGSSLSSGSPKKGFVYDLKINGATNTQFNQQMQALNLGWYYTWGLTGSPGLNLKFTPMCWGGPDAAKLNQIPSGSTELLAFNEPDGNNSGAQSNMSIEQIVALWPQLKATGLRIGSIAAYTSPLATSYTEPPGPPAAGRLPPAQTSLTTSYFDALWTALTQAGMTPDFIALHWYAPPNASGFLSWIDAIYAKYNKPIWITKMCPADWNVGKPGGPAFESFSTEEIQTFMDAVVSGMNSRPYVERYSWKTRPTNDVNMGNGALIALDGTLTPLGQHYASL